MGSATLTEAAQKTPRRRNKEATRAAILDAAEGLFAERGFADTSMSAVADRSGVTKSLIHHHFGSKGQLWEEVRERLLGRYLELQNKMMDAEAGGPSLLQASMDVYFRFLQQNPRVVRMIGWTLLECGEAAPASWIDLPTNKRGLAVFREAQRAGVFRDDVAPAASLIYFFSVIAHYFECRHMYRDLLPGMSQEEVDEMYLDAIKKITIQGLAPKTDG